MLIGQLWVNVAPYVMMDSEMAFIELCNSESNEAEEEDDKKEKKNKISFDVDKGNSNDWNIRKYSFDHRYFLSGEIPEVTTPPPEYFFPFI